MSQLNEPANAAVMKQAMLALTTTRKKLSRISCRRSGQMAAQTPTANDTADTLEKPLMAYVASDVDRA